MTTVEKMRAALVELSAPSKIIIYPDALHAFFSDYRPNYPQQPAEDGWKRLQVWFKQQGAA